MATEYTLPKPATEIIQQVKNEITLSQDFVQSKREEFRTRLKLYNNQRKQKDKIGDTSLYNVMNTLLAVYYADELAVKFSGRNMTDAAAAGNTEALARFDYDEMEMDIIDYLTQWDRFFFGVGIRYFDGWDEKRKTPMPKSMDTFGWLPDPSGFLMLKNFRFMGFEVSYTGDEITEENGFMNLDMLGDATNKAGTEMETYQAALREAQGLDDVNFKRMVDQKKEGQVYDMIDWLTKIKDEDGVIRKYIVTVNADKCDKLFRCEPFEEVTTEEKADPDLIPWPVTLNYFSPTRHDPFGTSVADLVEDKQRAKSVMKNLRLATQKAGLYPMYLYNRDKILNRRDLDFAFNKFIAVRGDVGDNVVQPLNKVPQNKADVLNEEQALDRDIEIAVGADKTAQGVLSSQQRTLGEIEQVTANQNLRYLLGSRVNGWGEKRFWKLWYRLYKQNFSDADEKIVQLTSAVGTRYLTLKRKDFITKEDPKIKISSRLEAEQKRIRERAEWAAVVPIIANDPTKPRVSKRYAERHLLRLYNLSQEQIDIMSPQTSDEMRASQENELLSRNERVPIDVEREDHMSHIVVHQQAEMTRATREHIEKHKQAYFQSGQYTRDQQLETEALRANQSLANQSQNQFGQQNASRANQPGTGVTPAAPTN